MTHNTFLSKNGITMTKVTHYNWEVDSTNNTFNMYVGDYGNMFGITFNPHKLKLLIWSLSNNEQITLYFHAKNLKDADKLAHSFIKGMGLSLKGTIFDVRHITS